MLEIVATSVFLYSFAGAARGGGSPDPCDLLSGPPSTFVDILLDMSCVECVYTESEALAIAVTTRAACSEVPCISACNVDHHFSSDACCSLAEAQARGGCYDPPAGCIRSAASALVCPPNIFLSVVPEVPCCYGSDTQPDRAVGTVGGSARGKVILEANSDCEATITLMSPELCLLAPPAGNGRVVTAFIASSMCDTVCMAIQATTNGVLSPPNVCNGATVALEICKGENIVESHLITFDDDQLDLSGDARFSQVDADLLNSLVNSTDPMLLSRFDFNYNHVIDAADVDVLQKLIDCGLGSGLFGDSNKDGVVNCCDLDAIPSALGKAIGDPGYIIELDYNLDGIINSTDESEIHGLVCIADWDNNYTRNFFDSAAFIAAYNNADPSVDLNADGNINFLDIAIFQGSFTQPCP